MPAEICDPQSFPKEFSFGAAGPKELKLKFPKEINFSKDPLVSTNKLLKHNYSSTLSRWRTPRSAGVARSLVQ